MKDGQIENYINEYGPILFRFCYSLTKDRYLGEELYQDTFLLLLSKKDEIDPDGNVKGYLCTVAARLWKDRKRKYARRFRIAPTYSDELSEIPEEKTTEGEVEKNILKNDIQMAIEELDEIYREVILLQYMGGLSIEEIGEKCNIPIGTVKSRIHYGKKQLKERLEGLGYGPRK
ncbi:MAG: RNA polymerase sigma factor [Tissierellia bacterium]|nr:RNA polymerase sigma factor [Tissierellia bacterium]